MTRQADSGLFAEPIPLLRPVTGFQSVPVRECGEPLEEIPADHPKLHVRPMYFERGIPGAEATLYARRGVIQRLCQAAQSLPDDIDLVVFDAWRPVAVQEQLFADFAARLQAASGLSGEALWQEVSRYVSVPSRDPDKPSAHTTGGALDVGLCRPNGELLDLGTEFDAFIPQAATRYLEEHAATAAEIAQRSLRRLLFHTMIRAGFRNYPEEWWHYDYGNQFYAKIRDTHAIYGYVERTASSREGYGPSE